MLQFCKFVLYPKRNLCYNQYRSLSLGLMKLQFPVRKIVRWFLSRENGDRTMDVWRAQGVRRKGLGIGMYIVCLDLEGVLVPEIWIAFAEASGIPELKKTTRDEPDYDKLMTWRLGVLKEHGLGLKEIQETIAKIDPIPGAKEFLDELRSMTQVIIISDTFSQFATPLMKKLGWPTIFCNSLEVAENGEIIGFKMRCEQSKLTTVKALQSIGYETIAAGDSYNDLGMIKASKEGFLFKSTDKIKTDNPQLAAYETYDELMAAIKKSIG